MVTEVDAAEFEATCLALIQQVADDSTEIVVVKDGQPLAKLVPATPPGEAEPTITISEAPPAEIFPPGERWNAHGTKLSPDGSAWATDG
ncbi:MAG: hypothetical protein R2754_06190 [Microthrixaceae bacterium]